MAIQHTDSAACTTTGPLQTFSLSKTVAAVLLTLSAFTATESGSLTVVTVATKVGGTEKPPGAKLINDGTLVTGSHPANNGDPSSVPGPEVVANQHTCSTAESNDEATPNSSAKITANCVVVTPNTRVVNMTLGLLDVVTDATTTTLASTNPSRLVNETTTGEARLAVTHPASSTTDAPVT